MLSWLAKPEWLILLAAIPLVGVLAWRARARRRQSLGRLGDTTSMQALIIRHDHPGWRVAGWFLVFALLAIAAAEPRWGAGPPPPTKAGCDAMLVVDVSRSMLANDALPDRLSRAKAALTGLVNEVQRRGGHRLGVVAVAGRAQLVCPLTHDYDHVRAKIISLSADPLPAALASTGASGTRLGAGIAEAVAVFGPADRGAQLIVLASDGDDPAGDEEWRAGISAARQAGIPIFTVGIGDAGHDTPLRLNGRELAFDGRPATTRLHEEPLRTLAQRTGGAYMTAGTAKPDLADFVIEKMNRFPTRELVAGTLPQPALRQQLFLVPAFVILMMLVGRTSFQLVRTSWQPVLLSAVALLLVGASVVPDDAIRRGVAALDAGQFETALSEFQSAAERTTDPGLVAFNEGVALYRLGRFREAELRFRWTLSDADGLRRPRALYNLGCALVQSSQGRRAEPLRQAVAAFEEALADPDLDVELRELVRENLEIARRMSSQLKSSPNAESNDQQLTNPASPGRETIERGDGPTGDANPRDGARARNENNGATAQPTDRRPMPGKGTLPPLADERVLAPLTAEDVQAHLDRAAARIAAAQKAQWQTNAAKPSSQFPDW